MNEFHNQFEDEELILDLHNNYDRAYTRIYNKYLPGLNRLAKNMCWDRDLEFDAIQEVFLKLHVDWKHFKSGDNLGGYLYVMLKNKILDLIKKDKTRISYLRNFAGYIPEDVNTTEKHLDAKELQQNYEKELAKLSPRMREVFDLSRKYNMKHKEIALLTGMSEGTVKRQISYALVRLRSRLICICTLVIMKIILYQSNFFSTPSTPLIPPDSFCKQETIY